MHSDWFNGIEILQGRWQHEEKVVYCYPSGLEKTLCKWDIYVPLVRKGLRNFNSETYKFWISISYLELDRYTMKFNQKIKFTFSKDF